MTLVACEIGQVGFVRYLRQLHELGVLSEAEVDAWRELHREVLLLEPALDDGESFDETAFADLERDLGET